MLCLIGAMTVANPEPRGVISRIKQRIETRKKYKDSLERVQFTRDSLSRIAYGWHGLMKPQWKSSNAS